MGKLACRNLKGGDKILASTEMFVSTENIDVVKMLGSTKYSHRQNVSVNKILALTEIWHRQKSSIDKMLAHAQEHLLTVWLGRVHSS
jgi:hypothetical protein